MKTSTLKIVKNFAFFLSISYFLLACSGQEPTLNEAKKSDTYAKSFLKLKNIEEFSALIKKVANMNRTELDVWEKEQGFVSMRHIYEEIVDVELTIVEAEEKQLAANPSLRSSMKHTFSKLYNDNSDIVTFTNFGYHLYIDNLTYASIVNKDGIIQVENVIYQITADKMKMIRSGDVAKINTLKNYKESGTFGEIEVREIIKSKSNLTDNKVRKSSTRRCDSDNGSYWLTGWFDSYQLPMLMSGTTPVTHLDVFITSRHLRDSIWGWIDHKTTSYTTSGSFSEECSSATINQLYGGYLPFTRGQSFSFSSGWGGHTAQAQYYFYTHTALGYHYTSVYNLQSLGITFNFLGQTCSVSL